MSLIKKNLRNIYSIFYNKLFSQIIKKFYFKKPLRVLIFHSIKDTEKFNRLIKALKRNWHIITPNEFFHLLDNNIEVSKPSLLITFDDGFKNNLKILSILDNYSISALFFICPGLVELESKNLLFPLFSKKQFRLKSNYEEIKLLNWDDLRFIQSKGHSIGNHSSFHYQVNRLLIKELQEDVNLSKNLLLKNLEFNKSFDSFSYPFGGVNHINFSSLKYLSKSFKYVFSGIRGNNNCSRSKIIFRDAVSLDDKIEITESLMKGCFDIYYIIKSIKLIF